jgi:hypothetical protein
MTCMYISAHRENRSGAWPWLGLFLAACGGGGALSVDDGATFADGRLPVVRSPDTGPGGLGGTCDVFINAGPSQGVYNAEALECQSRICIKPVVQTGAPGPANTTALCSATCTQDSDCAGELRDPANPLDMRCQTGFTCAIPFVKGKLYCMHYCLCKDFLSSAEPSTPVACQGDAGLTCNQ